MEFLDSFPEVVLKGFSEIFYPVILVATLHSNCNVISFCELYLLVYLFVYLPCLYALDDVLNLDILIDVIGKQDYYPNIKSFHQFKHIYCYFVSL